MRHRVISSSMSLGAVIFGLGCEGSGNRSAEFADDLTRVEDQSFDELAEQAAISNEPGRYLVEGDIALSLEGLHQYYANRTSVEKAIVTRVRNNATNAVFDATRSNPMNLRYCLTTGWGGTQASETDVEQTLITAARAWEGVAHVRFTHVAGSDGASCTQSIVGSTVDFVVKPNVGNLNGSYAWWAFAQVQELAVGGSVGLNVEVMTHELGHVLGLDHEQFHDSSGLGCTPPNYTPPAGNFSWDNQRELTAYDNQSIMHYYSGGVASCGGVMPAGWRMSQLDGMGMRSLYGNPDWWAAVLFAG